MNNSENKRIALGLNDWFNHNKRPLAWRNTREPYLIWLSEIIMQQTRISQGTPYYLNFVKNYPTIFDLAVSQEKNILKLWQGLGYYTRARNMLKTARLIVEDYQGIFPDEYKLLCKLPGIGDYTASVLLSVCFGKPFPVVDGNVTRVVSRLYKIAFQVNSTESKKAVKNKVQGYLEHSEPGKLNEALMDLGATLCMPANPACPACPLHLYCQAFKAGLQDSLPVKPEKVVLQKRYLHYFLIRKDDFIILNKRDDKDIWANLYELPLIETKSKTLDKDVVLKYFGSNNISFHLLKTIRHLLTHRELWITFYKIIPDNILMTELLSSKLSWLQINISDLDQMAVPKPVENFLKDETSMSASRHTILTAGKQKNDYKPHRGRYLNSSVL